jgi:hypothetical protein
LLEQRGKRVGVKQLQLDQVLGNAAVAEIIAIILWILWLGGMSSEVLLRIYI